MESMSHIENVFCEDMPILSLRNSVRDIVFNLMFLSTLKRNKTRKNLYGQFYTTKRRRKLS